MGKLKICFIVSQPGTAQSFFKTPMDRLKEDFDIYLAANIRDKKDVEGLPLKGYKAIQIERHPKLFADLKALWKLYKYFRKENFYVVHSMSIKASLLTSVAGFFAGNKHRIRIFTGQLWCNMTGLKRYFFKLLDKITVLLNTDLLADGHPQARYLIEQGIVKASSIKVLANGSICGIDVERFKYDESTRKKIREELKISDKVVFVFLGRLKKEKGIKELLLAFNKMIVSSPNAVLLLVGKDEENCQSWIKDYNNLQEGANVIFYGFTPRPNDLLMASDVFCNPSYREGFGLSVLEASCLGLPVICSDIYGMEDTMVDGLTGLRCKVMDVASLSDCMQQLYDNVDLRKRLGENGHTRVVKDFSKELVVNAWLDYYRKLS